MANGVGEVLGVGGGGRGLLGIIFILIFVAVLLSIQYSLVRISALVRDRREKEEMMVMVM